RFRQRAARPGRRLPVMSVLNDPKLDALLDRLHAQSSAQDPEIMTYFTTRVREGSLQHFGWDEKAERFLATKLVALDRDKAELCYLLCRSLRAKRVVEAGTSHGVSTLYLAAAVRDNLRADGGEGVVIATEQEPEKIKQARAHWAEADLTRFIELREGD